MATSTKDDHICTTTWSRRDGKGQGRAGQAAWTRDKQTWCLRSSSHETAQRKTQEHLLTDNHKKQNISLQALCAVLRRSVVSDSLVPHGL